MTRAAPRAATGDAFPPPRRNVRIHLVFGVAVAVLAVVAALVYVHTTRRLPSRGYTSLGLWLGSVGTACFLGVVVYAWRKRGGQEWMPGRLVTWMRVHLWMSALGLVAVWLHAGLHLDGDAGTVAMILLLLTLISGGVGWWFYVRVPAAVAVGPGNLATGAAKQRVAHIEEELREEAAGRSDAFQAAVMRHLGLPSAVAGVGRVLPEEQAAFARVEALARERATLFATMVAQERLRRQLRGWLWVHVPVAVLFLVAVPWHVYEALELRWTHDEAGPLDYASPESCAQCHPSHYEEWLLSSHATAQSSPIMDLQYRALMADERRTRPDGQAPVATLCVTCHAPTGYIGKDPSKHEPLEMLVEDRSPSSRYGVSCVTCHQIDAIHPIHPIDRSKDPTARAFVNMENLRWTQGRTMFGQFGAEGDAALPSVGNAVHQGAHLPVMGSAEFCASCHTVRVAKGPQGARKAPATTVLQDTYEEWREQWVPAEGRRGVDAGQALSCMDCHSRDLSGVASLARELAVKRLSLVPRREALVGALRTLRDLPLDDPYAAQPVDGFDLPLPKRRRYLHTFIGVDLHTEPTVPILPGTLPEGERAIKNAEIHAERQRRTEELLAISAGVRVASLGADGTLSVEIANLATGHKLPAGFAFAREMWLEVAVAPPGPRPTDPKAWRVLVGGEGGKPLADHRPLPRDDPNIHNLQAVLFDGDSATNADKGETVLQHEVTEVLVGKAANARGFLDREKYLEAGEARVVSVRLGEVARSWPSREAGWLRVRMRFRHLPPEFLERLARRFEGPLATDDDRRQAARARAIVGRLHILEVTEDVVEVTTVRR